MGAGEKSPPGYSTLDLARSPCDAARERTDVPCLRRPVAGDRSTVDRSVQQGSGRRMPTLTPRHMSIWQCGVPGMANSLPRVRNRFLLNEAIKTHPNPVLLDFLAGGRPVIWVDETLHGLHQDQGVLWLVQRYRLQTALLLFWATLLTLLWSMSGDLVRLPAHNPSARDRTSVAKSPGWPRDAYFNGASRKNALCQSAGNSSDTRWPQDAQAISADPLWGARLRAALAQRPVEGYRELSQLIAERRSSAKGLAHLDRDASDKLRTLSQQ